MTLTCVKTCIYCGGEVGWDDTPNPLCDHHGDDVLADWLTLRAEVEELEGCKLESRKRGNDCIDLSRIVVALRAEVETQAEALQTVGRFLWGLATSMNLPDDVATVMLEETQKRRDAVALKPEAKDGGKG